MEYYSDIVFGASATKKKKNPKNPQPLENYTSINWQGRQWYVYSLSRLIGNTQKARAHSCSA